jgi:hypothetical protein
VVVVVVEDDEGPIGGADVVVVVVRSVVVATVSAQPANRATPVNTAAPARMRKPDLVVVITALLGSIWRETLAAAGFRDRRAGQDP